MPTMVLGDDPAHNVTILDVAGKPIEWNGDVRQYCRYLAYLLNFPSFQDYVAAGSEAETVVRDSKDEQRDSDQYLVSGFIQQLIVPD